MTMLNWLLGLVIFVTGSVFYHLATDVSDADIPAYYNLQPVGPNPRIAAGDILAITPDGTGHEKICDFAHTALALDEEPIDTEFFNQLSARLPSFSVMAQSFFAAIGFPVDTVAIAEDGVEVRPFLGRFAALPEVGSGGVNLAETCQCKMAERILKRQRVCTVTAVLEEERPEGGRYARAFTLANYVNYVPEEQFRRCDKEFQIIAQETATDPPLCTMRSNHPWPAELRRNFSLIEKRDRRTTTPADRTAEISALAE